MSTVPDLVAALRARGQTLACAESLTGGALTSSFVEVPGASVVLRGGVVAYATQLKATLLGVDEQLLADRGAVDPQVASAMAVGVRHALGSTWGLATTGVAGPDPQDGQPVGTVYVALAGPSDAAAPHVRRCAFEGDRAEIRSASVRAAQALLAQLLIESGTTPHDARD